MSVFAFGSPWLALCFSLLVAGSLWGSGCSQVSRSDSDSNGDGDFIEGEGDSSTPESTSGNEVTSDPGDQFWESDDFDECATVSETAQNVFQPLDIIFTIDNTPSMLDEINEVRANMNRFSQEIIDSGLDAQIVLISCLPGDCDNDRFHGICIDAPLGAPDGCPEDGPYEDTNLPKYLHLSERVPSVKGLGITLDTYDDWQSMLRDGSKKHFVIVSDDTDETSAQAFHEAVLALGDEFDEYQFNGIFAYMSKDDACDIDESEPCCTFAAPEGNTDSWETVYADLVTMTGGVSGDLCLQDFDPVFEELAQSVIRSAELSCEWEIPEPPEGEVLDPTLVNIDFLDGEGNLFPIGNIADDSLCDRVDNAWYYDNPENPSHILVCPNTCDWIQGFTGAQIVLQFGCETETIVV